jgi:hypothetical protein
MNDARVPRAADLLGQQIGHLLVGEIGGRITRRPDHLHEGDHAWPDHLCRDQVLARKLENNVGESCSIAQSSRRQCEEPDQIVPADIGD